MCVYVSVCLYVCVCVYLSVYMIMFACVFALCLFASIKKYIIDVYSMELLDFLWLFEMTVVIQTIRRAYFWKNEIHICH